MVPGREKPGSDVSGAPQEQGRARGMGRVEAWGVGEDNHKGPWPQGHLHQRGSLDPEPPPAKSHQPLGEGSRHRGLRLPPEPHRPLPLKKLLNEQQLCAPAAQPQPLPSGALCIGHCWDVSEEHRAPCPEVSPAVAALAACC